DQNDQVPIGFPTTPEVIYGFGLSAGYRHFDVSCFFQGSARSSFWINVSGNQESTVPFISSFAGGNRAVLQYYADSHWSEDNRDIYALWPRLSEVALSNNQQTSTWFMRDGSFMRLKNAEIGYTVPEKLSRRLQMEKVRLYVSGSNLAVFSAFKMWDPEMAGNGLNYPLQRVFNVGVNVEF
ncbi:MAG: SusC/RagA family TonB-linked outer membrane protein, partial [Tannerella sp.]|nr:SusC/RagA family TonB-linked outer membrane protein [Tannerella sp.]